MWGRVFDEGTITEVIATLRPSEDPNLYWFVWIGETFLSG